MSSSHALCCLPSVASVFRSMYNKTIIILLDSVFCDIQRNQGFGKGYQPQPLVLADNPYLGLNYSGYHKNLIQ